LALTKELNKLDKARERLYQAVEQGTVPSDETLRARFHKLQARHTELLLERATLKGRRQLGLKKVSDAQIDAFCTALKVRFNDPSSGLAKAYLRLVVDEIRLEKNELKIRGSYQRLADAVGLVDRGSLGEVPRLVSNWRARRDSNSLPLGS